VVHHRAGLALRTRRSHPPDFVAAVEKDWRAAPLEPLQRALLTYAEKLTLRPAEMVEADLTPLREAGLDDRGILEANLVVAYFAYANRIADGLGVQLEPERDLEA
jgi:uncharacterized peroxidase-related enzyme